MIDMIARDIQRQSRLCFSGHKKTIFKQRLEERMTCLEMPDLAAYRDFLGRSPREEAELLELLTVNETYFFRNSEQFRYLQERIIPEVEKEKGEKVFRSMGRSEPVLPRSIMKLRVLCAGCSTGEEPYSVAMTLLEGLRYPKAWDIEILAVDLSENCVRSAAAGFYENEKLHGVPPSLREKYLERTADGACVRDEVKRLISFRRLNLAAVMDGEGFPGMAGASGFFDIVFCRNVMIYFSAEAQQHLVDTLFRLLVPGGYLFTGDAESLHMYNHSFGAVREAGCLIYQKMEMRINVEAV